jgi:hypothetical protein
MITAHTFLFGKPGGKTAWETWRETGLRAFTGFFYSRRRKIDGLFGFHKKEVISWRANDLLPSQGLHRSC